MSWVSISSATWLSGVSGAEQRGRAVITSRTLISLAASLVDVTQVLSPT